jgi:hypothetical protein
MKHFDPDVLRVLADFLINFSVFWFGLAIVSPVFPGVDQTSTLVVLILDIMFGIVSLLAAYSLRKELS